MLLYIRKHFAMLSHASLTRGDMMPGPYTHLPRLTSLRCGVLQAAGSAGAGALPEPTEAELEELYQAVDFHPEEQQAAAAAASRAGGGAGPGVHLSLDCLVTKASLLLQEAPQQQAAQQAAEQEHL